MMSVSSTTVARLFLALVMTALVLCGCREKPPLGRLQQAAQPLEKATASVDDLTDRTEALPYNLGNAADDGVGAVDETRDEPTDENGKSSAVGIG
jgi:hypothetical protein